MNLNPNKISIQPGTPVISADGKKVGVIKDAREDRFLVDVRWAPDYWLGTETVDDVSDNLVQLLLTKEAIGSAKLHDIGIDGTHLPSRQ